jgi:serine/threonine-protein kinase
MELLEGRDLAAVLQARGPLAIPDAVELVLQACEAVAEAHAAGIVHRDLKPANLFLTKGADGTPCVKVIDFGISKHTGEETKLTQEAEAMGSPLYMSPEQIRSSANVDARTDIWALAVVLYELVASKTPFHCERVLELITRVNFEQPTPLSEYRPDAPPAFEQVLLQALEKDRNRRYANVALFAAALAPFTTPRAAAYAERVAGVLGEQVAPARPTVELGPEPVAVMRAAAPPTTATAPAVVRPTTTPPAPKRRTGMLAVAVLGLLGLGAAGLVGWRGRSTPRAEAGPVTATPGPGASSTAPPVAPAASSERDRPPPATSAPGAPATVSAPILPAASTPPAPHPPIPEGSSSAAAVGAPTTEPTDVPASSGTVAPTDPVPRANGAQPRRPPTPKRTEPHHAPATPTASPGANLYDRGTTK